MRAADPWTTCPVCARPADRKPRCDCGWELLIPRQLGPVTDAMRTDFDRRLDAARLAFDARAAALVSADPGRFARWIRGGVPSRAQWAAARQQAALATAEALTEDTARKELAALLREVDPSEQAMLIEIGPEGIGVTRAFGVAAGAPRFEADQAVWQWHDLVPGLSAQPDERLLQLARGTGVVTESELRELIEDALQQGTYIETAVIICRPAGWALLEAAAELCAALLPGARMLRVAAEPTTSLSAGTIGRLTAAMPLLHGYGVIVATVDPVTGAVASATQPLFQPGDVPGAQASVTLRRFPGDRERATLAVAVDAAWSAEPHVVSVHTVPQPAPLYQVSAVLDPSGQVRFTVPYGVQAESRSWPEVRAGMPGAVDVRPGAVDLVCAIDLAGEPSQVNRRKDLVRDLLRELASEYPDNAMLRISVIGCVDHEYKPGEERKRVVRRDPLGSVDDAADTLARLRGQEIRDLEAASLEDLLHEAHGMLARTRKEGRIGRLLLVGGRRPRPPVLTVGRKPGVLPVQPCPHGYDWRKLLGQLGQAGVSTVAVPDVLPARSAKRGFWAEAGQDGLYSLPSASAVAVGEDLGLFIRAEQRIGLPLPA